MQISQLTLFLSFFADHNEINYEIADHCVTLKKSGLLHRVESLRTMSYQEQFSTTTEEAIKNLPRSSSEEIFDRVNSYTPCRPFK